jgi:diguanylate cyclase (GGDEF)-like protein
MEHQLRLLIVDDHQPDAELSALQIARGGFPCTWRRVETEAEFRTELREFLPDLILSDFTLPQYNGLAALELAVSEAPSVPFIFVSGTIGEKRAAEALTRGAADYVSKNDRRRLVLAVARVLGKGRPEGATSVQRIAGGLQMLASVRAAATSVHTATALLEEACRIVHGTNQYEYAFIALMDPHKHTAHTVAWTGAGADLGRNARFQVATMELADTSVIGRVLRTGEPVLCLDVGQYTGPLCEQERGAAPPASAFVSLPLLMGNTSIGALTVGTATHTYISEPELLLLEELARQLSLALQALPAEGTARHLSPVDPLTLLSKREFFREHLEHRLHQLIAQGATPTVIVFDIERLRDINNTHGRHVGDRLLQAVAERLTCRFGSSADLAHFGGGTFVAVFDERRSSDRADEAGTSAFSQSFTIADRPVPVTIKCGTACYPAHGRDAETLLRHAEAALATIRDRRGLPLQPLLSENVIDSRQGGLEQRLRLALKEEQFLIHYQPVIERLSGRIIAAEALLRWRDPERGLISPGVFLPALEQTGLIVSVGEWVLSRVVCDLARWHTLGLPKIRVAVNISTTELSRRGFARYFLDTVRLARPSPGIDIEIPESALFEDREGMRQTLKTLRGAGVRVVVDDFGMVHPSLACLAQSPVDSLKIDRSFINQLSCQPQSQVVVSSIVAVARACGLRTVAEGVETMEQLEIVDALGCEQSQGYLHSPPVPAEQLRVLLGACSGAMQS